MSTIQFEPRIATEPQIDWQRPSSGQTADLFADLLADRLKRQGEADRSDLAPRRHQPPADPLSGRAARSVAAQARTLRGEAKPLGDPEPRLIHREADQAEEERPAGPEEERPVGPEAAPASESDSSALAAAAQDQPGAADAAEEATVACAEAMPVADAASAAPPMGVPVAAPQDGLAAGDPAPEPLAVLPAPAPVEPDALAPEQTEPPVAGAPEETPPGSPDAATAADVATVAETALSDFAVAPDAAIADQAPTNAGAPVVAAQPKDAATKDAGARLLPEVAQASEALPEFVPPPAKHRSEPPAPEARPRPGVPRAPAVRPDPMPASAATHAAQPHQPILPSQSAAAHFGGAADLPEHPLSGEGAGPGWMLHLAQGAASRRAEFVAQLRQHLQNVPAHEQVAVHIQRAVRDGTGRFSIQLSPAELGQIHVKMEIDEEKRVTASVTVERPSTLELLQRDIKGLERALHNAGLTMEGGDLSFSLGRGGDQGSGRDANRAAVSPAQGSAAETDPGLAAPAGSATQVMDTAAGIVDVQA